ncbi:hypothetical protein [Jonesia quinghaiensis]|uniref:hypothetical protein n=1 Tax=Jonesia quinghaiensis TaxID=262806 RepID=UPI0004289A4A|nr:hypothetical protein [Jonesia quinghaiensis]
MGGLFTWEVLVVVIIPALCGAIPLTAIVLTWSQTSGPVKILGCCCAWLFSLASPILGQPFDLSLDGVGLSILVGLMLGHGWGVPLATAVILGVKEFSPSGGRTPGVRRTPSSMDNAFEDAL